MVCGGLPEVLTIKGGGGKRQRNTDLSSEEPTRSSPNSIPSLDNFKMIAEARDATIVAEVVGDGGEFYLAVSVRALDVESLDKLLTTVHECHRHSMTDTSLRKYGALFPEAIEMDEQRQKLNDVKTYRLAQLKAAIKAIGIAKFRELIQTTADGKRKEEQDIELARVRVEAVAEGLRQAEEAQAVAEGLRQAEEAQAAKQAAEEAAKAAAGTSTAAAEAPTRRRFGGILG